MSTHMHTEHADGAHDQQAIAHIAAAIDPYPEGRDAAALGAALAQATDADLMLFAVEPDLPLLVPGMNWKSIRKETEALLARTRESFAPHARVAIETDLSIRRGLERAMRSENRDLLVVGSSHHGPQGKVSIGRLTRQLLDDFQCALAVAPRGLSERPPDDLTGSESATTESPSPRLRSHLRWRWRRAAAQS
jgi:nucleotide-binding universal stress UspA family protein